MRVLLEGQRAGGVALNYARVSKLLRDAKGQVVGVAVEDRSGSHRTEEIKAKAVVNATGVWADELCAQIGRPARLRAIRGSHLIIPQDKLPVPEALSLLHPRDGRAVFVLPWLGVTLVGTTDIDHEGGNEREPHIADSEVDYLMELLGHVAPECRLDTSDIVGTYSGVRPVVRTGARDPSKESREHAIWSEDGLVTVTGGKLTTFRMMARMTLKALEGRVSVGEWRNPPLRPTTSCGRASGCRRSTRRPASGSWGSTAPRRRWSTTQLPGECRPVPGSPVLWAELRWAARSEGVVHLDDLMLRRTRLGLLLPEGAQGLLEQVKGVVQVELGWQHAQWAAEVDRDRGIWRSSYGPPGIVGAS